MGNKYAVGNHGGQTTKYSDEILNKTKQYVLDWQDKKLPDEVIPSVEGLSVYLEVARSSIYEWIKLPQAKEFADIYARLLSLQGRALLNGGLSAKFNSTITKLILSKHGYREEMDVTSGGQPLALTFDENFQAFNAAPRAKKRSS